MKRFEKICSGSPEGNVRLDTRTLNAAYEEFNTLMEQAQSPRRKLQLCMQTGELMERHGYPLRALKVYEQAYCACTEAEYDSRDYYQIYHQTLLILGERMDRLRTRLYPWARRGDMERKAMECYYDNRFLLWEE